MFNKGEIVHHLALLVHVVRDAGHVRIEHHHHEAFGTLWRIVPDDLGVPIGTKTHMVFFTVDPECEFLGNRLAFIYALNLKFHGVASCRLGRWLTNCVWDSLIL